MNASSNDPWARRSAGSRTEAGGSPAPRPVAALAVADAFAEGVADALDGHPWSTRLARQAGYAEGYEYATRQEVDAIEDRAADDYTGAIEACGLQAAAGVVSA